MVDTSEATTLFRIAKRYYIDGKLQIEIAREEGISRSLVSKLLTKARESGIVNIEIAMPESASAKALENMLEERLGVVNPIVLPSTQSDDGGMDEINALAIQAAALLPEMLADYSFIGIGWGRTLYQIATELDFINPVHPTTFVPLLGNSGLYNRYLQTSSIADRFAEKYNSRCFYLSAYVSHATSAPLSAYEKTSINELESLWQRLDVAIFSLSSASTMENYYYAETMDAMPETSSIDPSACGEIISQAFCPDGSFTAFGSGYRLIALPLDRLRNIENTICVAVGRNKAYSMIWAVRCGFAKTIITDMPTALAMEEILNNEK